MAQLERDLGEGGLVFDEIEGCGVDAQRIGPRFPESGAGVGLEERCPDQTAGIGPRATAAESTRKRKVSSAPQLVIIRFKNTLSAEYQRRSKDKRQRFLSTRDPPCEGEL